MIRQETAHLSFLPWYSGADAIATLDHVSLEADRSWGSMELQERPQALQRTEPYSSLRHSGVVDVVQFWHTGCREP